MADKPKPIKKWTPLDPRNYFTKDYNKTISDELTNNSNELLSKISEGISSSSLVNLKQTPEQIAAMTPEQRALYEKTIKTTLSGINETDKNNLKAFTLNPPTLGELPTKADVYGKETFSSDPDPAAQIKKLVDLGVREEHARSLNMDQALEVESKLTKGKSLATFVPVSDLSKVNPNLNLKDEKLPPEYPAFVQGTEIKQPQSEVDKVVQDVFDKKALLELDKEQQTNLLDNYRGAGILGSRYADALMKGLSNSVLSGYGFYKPKDVVDLLEKPVNMLDHVITKNAKVPIENRDIYKYELPAGMEERYMNGGEKVITALSEMLPDVFVGLGLAGKITQPLSSAISNSKTLAQALGYIEKGFGTKVAEYIGSKLPEIISTVNTFELPTITRGLTGVLAGNESFKQLGKDIIQEGLMGVAFGSNPFRNYKDIEIFDKYSKKLGTAFMDAVERDPSWKEGFVKTVNDAVRQGKRGNDLKQLVTDEIRKFIQNGDGTAFGETIPDLWKKAFDKNKLAEITYTALVPALTSQLTNMALNGGEFDLEEFAKSSVINTLFSIMHKPVRPELDPLRAIKERMRTKGLSGTATEPPPAEEQKKIPADLPAGEQNKGTEGTKPPTVEPTLDELIEASNRFENANGTKVEKDHTGQEVIVPAAQEKPEDVTPNDYQSAIDEIKNKLSADPDIKDVIPEEEPTDLHERTLKELQDKGWTANDLEKKSTDELLQLNKFKNYEDMLNEPIRKVNPNLTLEQIERMYDAGFGEDIIKNTSPDKVDGLIEGKKKPANKPKSISEATNGKFKPVNSDKLPTFVSPMVKDKQTGKMVVGNLSDKELEMHIGRQLTPMDVSNNFSKVYVDYTGTIWPNLKEFYNSPAAQEKLQERTDDINAAIKIFESYGNDEMIKTMQEKLEQPIESIDDWMEVKLILANSDKKSWKEKVARLNNVPFEPYEQKAIVTNETINNWINSGWKEKQVHTLVPSELIDGVKNEGNAYLQWKGKMGYKEDILGSEKSFAHEITKHMTSAGDLGMLGRILTYAGTKHEKPIESIKAKYNEIVQYLQDNHAWLKENGIEVPDLPKFKAFEDLPQVKEYMDKIKPVDDTTPPAEVKDVPLSSTQVNIPEVKPFTDYLKKIDDKDVYTEPDGSKGKETEPHVTALYGLKTSDPKEVQKIVNKFGDVTVKLGKTSIFKNDNYDVLKVDVDSKDLIELNKMLKTLDYQNDFPDYTPHLTLAYLKSGTGEKYAGDTTFEGKEFTIKDLIFSDPDRNHTPIKLSPTPPAGKKPKRNIKDLPDYALTEQEYIDKYVDDKYSIEVAKDDYAAIIEKAKSDIVYDGKDYWWQDSDEMIWHKLDDKGELTNDISDDQPKGEVLSSLEYDNRKQKSTKPKGKVTTATTKEDKDKAQKDLDALLNPVTPAKKDTPVKPAKTSGRYNIVEQPIKEINVDLARFQNRDEEYAEESTDKILSLIKAGKFNFDKYDPVKLWKDPADNKIYVLAGHSRLEAFKKATEEGIEGFDTIPAKITTFATEKEASDFAKKESNTLGTAESLTARAKIYRDMRKEGKSEKEIQAEGKKNEQKNWMDVNYLSYLKPKGSMIQLYNTLDGASSEVRSRIQKMASAIGRARKEFDKLTDQHEEEIYAWLNKKKDFGYDDLRTKLKFLEEGSWDFDYANPLNLEKKAESLQEVQFRKELKDLKDLKNKASKELEQLETDISIQTQAHPELNEESDRLQKLVDDKKAEIRSITDAITKLNGQLDKYLDAAKDQEALFSPIEKWEREDMIENENDKSEEIRRIKEDTPEFIKWFGNSKVVDEDGYPLVVYHGTTHNFDTFTEKNANAENHLGKMFYFTDSLVDVNNNYAGEGADLTGRLERLTEDILNTEFDSDEQFKAEAKKRAEELIKGQSEGAIMPVYLKIEKPLYIGKDLYPDGINGETHFEFKDINKLYKVIKKVLTSAKYEDYRININNVFKDLEDNVPSIYDGWVPASEIDDGLRKCYALMDAFDYDETGDQNGALLMNDIIKDIYQAMGFDGVIIDADAQFGNFRKVGQKMLMDYGTKHYHVFKSTQIKSATGNNGAYSSRNKSIIKSPAADWKPTLVDPFYSQLERSAQEKIQNNATPDQIRAALLKSGLVKQAEWNDIGMDDYLEGKNKVDKADLMDFIQANKLQMKEVVKGEEIKGEYTDEEIIKMFLEADPENSTEGLSVQEMREWLGENIMDRQEYYTDTKYSEYTLAGGDKYKERLYIYPMKEKLPDGYVVILNPNVKKNNKYWVLVDEKNNIKSYGDTPADAITSYYNNNKDYKGSYKEKHWNGELNVIMHSREQELTTVTGEKVLNVEEGQSQLHQDARKKGYETFKIRQEREKLYRDWKPIEDKLSELSLKKRNFGNYYVRPYKKEGKILDNNWAIYFMDTHYMNPIKTGFATPEEAVSYKKANFDMTSADKKELKRLQKLNDEFVEKNIALPEGGLPDFPLKKNWHEVIFKRMLRVAAEGGYKKLTWTKGKEQADRYKLSNKVDYISRTPSRTDDDVYVFVSTTSSSFDLKVDKTGKVKKYSGNKQWQEQMLGKNLAEIIGKDLATKILEETSPEQTTYTGIDLDIGGKGMIGFYDKIWVDYANKLGKKYGVRVGEEKVVGNGYTLENTVLEKSKTGAVLKDIDGNMLQYVSIGKVNAENKDNPNGAQLYAINEVNKAKNLQGNTSVHSIELTPNWINDLLYKGQAMYSPAGEWNSENPIVKNLPDIIEKYAQLNMGKIEDVAIELTKRNMQDVLPFLPAAYREFLNRDLSVAIKNEVSNEEQIKQWEISNNGSTPADKNNQDTGQQIQVRHASDSADRRAKYGLKPATIYADEENIPSPKEEYVTIDRFTGTDGNPAIDEHQRFAINLAIQRFMDGGEAFGLFDTTGFGKTSQLLGTGKYWMDHTKKPVLIVSPNKQVINKSYKKDAKRMRIALSQFEVGTYDDLRLKKIGGEDYGLVIFDESQNLKNFDALKTIEAMKIKSDHIMYVSATPMDDPKAAIYFINKLTGKPIEEIMRRLGLRYEMDEDTNKMELVLDETRSATDLINTLLDLRNTAIRSGSMIRREVPFWGAIHEKYITPTNSQEFLTMQADIFEHYARKIKGILNSPIPQRNAIARAYGQARANELMRLAESFKVDAIFEHALEMYSNGIKPVIVGKGINPTMLTSINTEVKGFLGEMALRFERAGIPFSKLYGSSTKLKEQAMDEFQSDKTDIILMTPESGGVGIDLDDQNYGKERGVLVSNSGFSGMIFVQSVLGRVNRRKTTSSSNVYLYYDAASISDMRRQEILAGKIRITRALQEGIDIDTMPELFNDKGEVVIRRRNNYGSGEASAQENIFSPVKGWNDPDIKQSRIESGLDKDLKPELMAMHNLTLGNLEFAIRMGGFALPSLAITKVSLGFEKYGEISLIAPKEFIDPEQSRTESYSRDIYSPTYPTVYRYVNSEALQELITKIKAEFPEFVNHELRFSYSDLETDTEKGYYLPESLGYKEALKYYYLKKTNNLPEFTMRPEKLHQLPTFKGMYGFAKELVKKYPLLFGVRKDDPKYIELKKQYDTALEELNKARDLYFKKKRAVQYDYPKEQEAFYKIEREFSIYRETFDKKILAERVAFAKEYIDKYFETSSTYKGLEKKSLEYFKKDWYDAIDTKWNRINLDRVADDVEKLLNKKTEFDKYKYNQIIDAIIEKQKENYNEFLNKTFEDILRGEYIKDGNRKVSHTLENAKMIMGDKLKGVEKTITHGLGKAATDSAIHFDSIDKMRKESYRLVKHEIFQEKQKELESAFHSLPIEKYHRDYSSHMMTFTPLDQKSKFIGKVAKTSRMTDQQIRQLAYRNGFYDIPDLYYDDIREVAQLMKRMPTEYFEAKSPNIVSLNQFKAAIVPQTVSKTILEALSKAGLQIGMYNPNIPEDRQAVTEDLLQEQALLFSPVKDWFGKMVVATALTLNPAVSDLEVPNAEAQNTRIEGSSENTQEYNSEPIQIVDNRKIDIVSGKPVTDKNKLTANSDPDIIREIVGNSLQYGYDPYTMLAMAFQETGIRPEEAGNPFHIFRANETIEKYGGDPIIAAMEIFNEKQGLAKRLGKTSEADIIQGWNGYGKISPKSEYKVNSYYGIDVSKKPIDMNTNPVYGNRILDIRENIIKKNPFIIKLVNDFKSGAFDNISMQSPVKNWSNDVVLNDNFKKWFGTSKVVDKQGYPLAVYHGSPDLSKFKEDYIFKTSYEQYAGTGKDLTAAYYFTDNYSKAKSYADPYRAFDTQNAKEGIETVYLKIENPLRVDAGGEVWRKFEITIDGTKLKGTREIVGYAKGKGYDGVIVENVKDRYNENDKKGVRAGTVYTVFNPNQIKSSSKNNGDYSLENNSIIKSPAEEWGGDKPYTGAFGIGIGNPYEYIKTLEEHREKMLKRYMETKEYRYYRELEAIDKRVRQVEKAIQTYKLKNKGIAIRDTQMDPLFDDPKYVEIQIENLIDEGKQENGLTEQSDPEQLALFSATGGDFARFEVDIMRKSLGRINNNGLAEGTNIPAAELSMYEKQQDAGGNSSVSYADGGSRAEIEGSDKQTSSSNKKLERRLAFNETYLERTQKLMAEGQITFTGLQVNTPEDLGYAVQVLRDPRMETFRIIYYDENNQHLGTRSISSRFAGMVSLPDMDSLIRGIQADIQRLGAKVVDMTHNHPIGDPTSSYEDLLVTKRVMEQVPELRFHAVTNHGKFSIIRRDIIDQDITDISKGDFDYKHSKLYNLNLGEDFLKNFNDPSGLLGKQLSAANLPEFAKKLQMDSDVMVLIGVDPYFQTTSFIEVPIGMADDYHLLQDYLREEASKTGSITFIVATASDTQLSADGWDNIKTLVETNKLLDFVDNSKTFFGEISLRNSTGQPYTQEYLQAGRSFGKKIKSETYWGLVKEKNNYLQDLKSRVLSAVGKWDHNESTIANFTRWFGNSKVVDENGKPLEVYHGTPDKIEVFDSRYGGDTTANNEYGAFYFTNTRTVAEDYSRQAFIRRYEDRSVEEIMQQANVSKKKAEQIYNDLNEAAEKNIKVVNAFLRMETPYIIDMKYQLLPVERIQKLIGFFKEGLDPDGSVFNEIIDSSDYKFEDDDIENYREEIEEYAREQNGLDPEDEISEYDFMNAAEEVLDGYGIYRDIPKYDGIIIKNTIDDISYNSQDIQDEYIVWDPSQIKSSDKNNGDYSEYNYNILRSAAKNWIQPSPAVTTDAFKKWFGDSIVRNKDGSPKVMYHSTRNSFDTFEQGDIGFHVGTLEHAENRLADFGFNDTYHMNGQNIMPLYVKINKVLTLPDVGSWDDPDAVYETISHKYYQIGKRIQENDGDIQGTLRLLGYDGIRYRNKFETNYKSKMTRAERDHGKVIQDLKTKKYKADANREYDKLVKKNGSMYSLVEMDNEFVKGTKKYVVMQNWSFDGKITKPEPVRGFSGDSIKQWLKTPANEKLATEFMNDMITRSRVEYRQTVYTNPEIEKASEKYLKTKERINKYEDTKTGDYSYIVFDPSQLKSATGNNGNFDPLEDSVIKSPVKQWGENSNLKKFMAGSKILNDDGTYMKLYHGTTYNKPIDKFDMNAGWDITLYGQGIYLSYDPKETEQYAGYYDSMETIDEPAGTIYPLYANIKNPYEIYRVSDFNDEYDESGGDGEPDTSGAIELLKADGYDGIISYDERWPVVVAFYDYQVKSATGNNGNYSKKSASIVKSPSGEWPMLPQNASDNFFENNKDLFVRIGMFHVKQNPEISLGEFQSSLISEFEKQKIPFKITDDYGKELYDLAIQRYAGIQERNAEAKVKKLKKRKFVKRFKESDEQSERVKAEITNDWYKEVGNKETADKSLKLVDEEGIDVTMNRILTNDPEILGEVKVAATVLIALRNKNEEELLRLEGRLIDAQKLADRTADLIDYVSENLGTAFGRTIQAFTLLNKLTAGGWIRKLKKALQPATDGDKQNIEQQTESITEQFNGLNAEEIENLINSLEAEKRDLIKQLFGATVELEEALKHKLTDEEKQEMFAEYNAQIENLHNQFNKLKQDKQMQEAGMIKQIEDYQKQLQQSEWLLKELQARLKEYEDKDKAITLINTIQGTIKDQTDRIVDLINKGEGHSEDIKEQAKTLKDQAKRMDDAATRLARKVIQSLKPPKKADPPDEVKLMVKTLWEIAKENDLVPEQQPMTRTKLIEIVGMAVKRTGEYSDVWDLAKEVVSKKLKDEPEKMQKLEDYFNHYLQNPFSEKEISSVVKTGIKELDINITNVVKLHETVVDAAKKSLLDKLIIESGVEGEAGIQAIQKFVNALEKKWNEITEDRRVKILENQFKISTKKAKEMYEKIIEWVNLGAFTKDQFRPLVAEKIGVKVITPEMIAQVKKLADNIQKLPNNSIQQSKAIKEMLDYISTQKGIKISEVGWGLWYSSILSGISTQIKNFTENTLLKLNGLTNRDPREIPSAIKGIINGMQVGWPEFKATLKGDIPRHLTKGKYEESMALELIKFKGGYYNPLSYAKYVGRLLKAVDVMDYFQNQEMEAYGMAYQEAKKSKLKGDAFYDEMNRILNGGKLRVTDARLQAEKEGLSGIDFARRVNQILEDKRCNDIKNESEDYGLFNTFNNRPIGVAGAIARAIQHLQKSKAGKPSKVIVPFTNIVANVFNMQLNFTPVGIFRGAYGYYHGFDNGKGGVNKLTKRQQWAYYMNGLKGTLMFLLLGYLMLTDGEDGKPLLEITANGMADGKKRAQLMSTGWKPYSIRLFGRYIPYDYISPVLIPMLALGIIQDNIRYRKDNDDIGLMSRIETTILLTISSVMDKSFMSGIADLFRALDPNRETVSEKYLTDLALRTASAVVPNFVKQLKYVWDPQIYEANTLIGKFIKNVGIGQDAAGLKPKINVLGDPVVTDWNRIFVYTGSKKIDDPVWNWIVDNGCWIPTPDKDMLIYDKELKKDRKMTPEEYYDFYKARGIEIKKSIQDNLELLNKLPQDEKRKARDVIVRTAGDNAMLRMTGHANRVSELDLNVTDQMVGNLQKKIRENIRKEEPDRNILIKADLEKRLSSGNLSADEQENTEKILKNWDRYNKMQTTLFKIDDAISRAGLTREDGKPYTYMLTDKEKENFFVDWKRVGNRFSTENQYYDEKKKKHDSMRGAVIRAYNKHEITKEQARIQIDLIMKARNEILKVKKGME